LKAGDVTVRTLATLGLIKKVRKVFPFVKILGNGTVKNALNLKGIEASAGAKKAIEAAGGKVLK
jgi:large subunit ribosomal protein L15